MRCSSPGRSSSSDSARADSTSEATGLLEPAETMPAGVPRRGGNMPIMRM